MIEISRYACLSAAAAKVLLPPPDDFVPFEDAEVEQSIVERFEQQVERHPNRVAVHSPLRQLTYRELNREANRIARRLTAHFGWSQEPVAILMEKDAGYFAAILGALKAGKFYVPLAPEAPRERNAAILSQAQARVLLTDGSHEQLALSLAPEELPVWNLASLELRADDDNLARYVAPDSPANIIFTSGSTGEPKGTILSHRAILHNIQNFTNDLLLRPSDRILCLGAAAFSGILKDVFGALLNGATLLPLDVCQTGLDGLTAFCRQTEVTVFDATPTLFRTWAENLAETDYFGNIRVLRLGGEAVTSRDVEFYRRHFPDRCVLANGYGPTEVGTVTMWVMAHDDDPLSTATLHIGRECSDMEVLLVDDLGQEVEPGEVGQIAVRSNYLATGYWQRPDLTHAAFRPEAEGEGRRVYLTGDRARRRSDGCLEFAGRNDFQVKIRGFRVEIGEVEAALQQVPVLRDAVVVPYQDGKARMQLAAYIVPRAGAVVPSVRELRSSLRQRLPDYSIPKLFIPLSALPVNSNGKLDRRALPLPSSTLAPTARTYVAPRNDVERQLASIWEEELEQGPIGITDDFFELGGDSLVATGLMAHLEMVFDQPFPISILAEGATIEYLANRMQHRSPASPATTLVALKSYGSRTPFFCVHALGGHVLFLEKLAKNLHPEQPVYAFQSQGADSQEEPLTSIEEMAAQYVSELIRFQPTGPYYLGGYSLGGTIAYEMARQLNQRGLEVALLAVIDQRNFYSPRPSRWNLSRRGQFLRNVLWWLWDDFLASSPRQMWQRLWTRLGKIGFGFVRTGQVDGQTELKITDLGLDWVARLPQRHLQLMEANFKACRRYVPSSYAGHMVLIRTRGQALMEIREDDMGWAGLVHGGLEIHTVPGNHANLFEEPQVCALADKLQQIMDAARGEKTAANA